MTYEEAIAAARKGRKFTREEFEDLYAGWLAETAKNAKTFDQNTDHVKALVLRNRVMEALRAHGERMTANQIAEAVGHSPESVRGSIRHFKGIKAQRLPRKGTGPSIWYEVAE